jgi:large subunit ribosomal protein L25
MEQFAIAARKRDKLGTSAARAYRREGLIPGVICGHGQETTEILVDAKELQGLLRHHGNLIGVTIDGVKNDANLAALLKEIQRDPVSRAVLSVDLQWVSLAESVELHVPVALVGTAPGVARDGGSLDQVMHEIAIACLPGDIPDTIEVDLSGLELGHTIHVRDLVAPPSVTLMSPADDAVVTITRPVRAEDLEAHLEAGEVAVAGEDKSEE